MEDADGERLRRRREVLRSSQDRKESRDWSLMRDDLVRSASSPPDILKLKHFGVLSEVRISSNRETMEGLG